jgi:hypothetical protein
MSSGKTSVMVSLGMPRRTSVCSSGTDDKPICRNSLRKHFKKELETGATKLNAKVGHFMVATNFQHQTPDGLTPIKDGASGVGWARLFLKGSAGLAGNRLEPARRPEGGAAHRRTRCSPSTHATIARLGKS